MRACISRHDCFWLAWIEDGDRYPYATVGEKLNDVTRRTRSAAIARNAPGFIHHIEPGHIPEAVLEKAAVMRRAIERDARRWQ